MTVAVKHIDEIKAELETIRAKKAANKPERDKRDWYGLVYCDPNGWASVIGDDLEGIWLGRTDEIIPYLKSRRINGQNTDMVLQAVKEFWSEKDSHSCHSRLESGNGHIIDHSAQPIVATFSKDPQFLRLLDRLISQGLGIRAIHSEVRSKGYEVPMRTLARWVKKRRDS